MINSTLRRLKQHKLHVLSALYDVKTRDQRVAKSLDYWRSLKGLHTGRRGFVIGNGPSLRMGDLECLQDEISIASNKIYLAFDQVQWRPTYYTICDYLVWLKIREKVAKHVEKIHIPDYLNGIPLRIRRRVNVWRTLSSKGRNDGLNVFSDDATNGLAGGGTVTYENVQLAAHLGLNPIYIIGCDHYYSNEFDVKQDVAIKVVDGSNHFIKGYRKPGEKVAPACFDIMNAAYQSARKYSDETGVEIFNATRGGHLEAFKRVDFKAVVQ